MPHACRGRCPRAARSRARGRADGADRRLGRRRRSLWLVDAVASGAEAGTVHRFDASEHELPAELFRASTHHSGSPRRSSSRARSGGCRGRTVVFGIEGGSFEVGDELTAAVAARPSQVADAVREEVGHA